MQAGVSEVISSVNKRYSELKPQLDEILAKSAKQSRNNLIILFSLAGICALTGACMLLFWDDDRNIIGFIVGGFGIFLGAIAGGTYAVQNPQREIEKVHSIIAYSPELLVWSYVYRVTTNGVPAHFVVLKFRGKTEYKVPAEALPRQDCESFIKMLLYINPAMKVGYHDGYKEMYRKNQL